jgi:hypothetical protein
LSGKEESDWTVTADRQPTVSATDDKTHSKKSLSLWVFIYLDFFLR